MVFNDTFFVFVGVYLVCIFGSCWCLLGILKHLTNEERIAIKGGGTDCIIHLVFRRHYLFWQISTVFVLDQPCTESIQCVLNTTVVKPAENDDIIYEQPPC